MLLVYAGQSFAALDAPCAGKQSHDTHSMQAELSAVMQHGGHQHNPDSADGGACDCCDEAQCSMVHCTSAPAVLAHLQGPSITHGARVFESHYANSYAAANRAALYRPPIYR